MRTHLKSVGIIVAGVLASCLAFQSPTRAQSDAAKDNCLFFYHAYRAVSDTMENLGLAVGAAEMRRELKNDDVMRDNLIVHPSERKFREANPELKSLWQAYIDCLNKQYDAEQQARQQLLPKPPESPKPPETPQKSAEVVIWDILMRVRVAPDPDEELRLAQEDAVAEILAALEDQDQPAKPRKSRKRTRTGGNGEETTQTHDPGTSTAMIMLLGTAAGIATDSLRHRGSGGGGPAVKPGSGGCTGGTCRR